MADEEDKSQNTEQPTQKRLDQARESGDTVKSSEVNTLILLGGGTLAIAMFGKSMAMGIAHALTVFLEQPDAMSVDGAGLSSIVRVVLVQLVTAVAPFFAAMIAASVAGHLIQGRPVLNFDRLAPDFSKVSPMAGFKRMFGIEGWMNLVKGLLKIAIVGIAIWTQLWPERGKLEAILTQSTADAYAGATVRALRLKPVTSVLTTSACSEAIETMRDKGFDQLPVLTPTGGRLAGLVTLGNLLSYISRGRATPATEVRDVMFDFSRIDEVVTDPRRFGVDLKDKKRKFVEITLDTPLGALSRFLEWNSAAVVTEKGGEGAKPVAVVTKVDLLSWMVRQKA